MTLKTVQKQDPLGLFVQIEKHFDANRTSEIICLSLLKSHMPQFFKIEQKKGQEPTNIAQQVIQKIQEESKKSFTIIGIHNDVNDPKSKANVVFANTQKITRMEYLEYGQDPKAMAGSIVIRMKQVNLSDDYTAFAEIESLVKGFQDDAGQVIMGSYQDQKNIENVNFVLIDTRALKVDQTENHFITGHLLKNIVDLRNVATKDTYIQQMISLHNSKDHDLHIVIANAYKPRQNSILTVDFLSPIEAQNRQLKDGALMNLFFSNENCQACIVYYKNIMTEKTQVVQQQASKPNTVSPFASQMIAKKIQQDINEEKKKQEEELKSKEAENMMKDKLDVELIQEQKIDQKQQLQIEDEINGIQETVIVQEIIENVKIDENTESQVEIPIIEETIQSISDFKEKDFIEIQKDNEILSNEINQVHEIAQSNKQEFEIVESQIVFDTEKDLQSESSSDIEEQTNCVVLQEDQDDPKTEAIESYNDNQFIIQGDHNVEEELVLSEQIYQKNNKENDENKTYLSENEGEPKYDQQPNHIIEHINDETDQLIEESQVEQIIEQPIYLEDEVLLNEQKDETVKEVKSLQNQSSSENEDQLKDDTAALEQLSNEEQVQIIEEITQDIIEHHEIQQINQENELQEDDDSEFIQDQIEQTESLQKAQSESSEDKQEARDIQEENQQEQTIEETEIEQNIDQFIKGESIELVESQEFERVLNDQIDQDVKETYQSESVDEMKEDMIQTINYSEYQEQQEVECIIEQVEEHEIQVNQEDYFAQNDGKNEQAVESSLIKEQAFQEEEYKTEINESNGIYQQYTQDQQSSIIEERQIDEIEEIINLESVKEEVIANQSEQIESLGDDLQINEMIQNEVLEEFHQEEEEQAYAQQFQQFYEDNKESNEQQIENHQQTNHENYIEAPENQRSQSESSSNKSDQPTSFENDQFLNNEQELNEDLMEIRSLEENQQIIVDEQPLVQEDTYNFVEETYIRDDQIEEHRQSQSEKDEFHSMDGDQRNDNQDYNGDDFQNISNHESPYENIEQVTEEVKSISSQSSIQNQDIIEEQKQQIQEEEQQSEQIEQLQIEQPIIYEELQFDQYEDIQVQSHLREYYKTKGPFNVDPNKSKQYAPVVYLMPSSKIYKNSWSFSTEYMNYSSSNQEIIETNQKLNMPTLEQLVKMNLEYVGIHELWVVYRIKPTQFSLNSRFLYVSLNERVLANCLHEVHYYKYKITSSDGLYREEFAFTNYEQLHTYAVVVQRPSVDLKALFKIWKSNELSDKKYENQSDEKILYIVNQIQQIYGDVKWKGINHGLMRDSSFFINLQTYKVELGSYAFALNDGTSEESNGCMKGLELIQAQERDMVSVNYLIKKILKKSEIPQDQQQLILSNIEDQEIVKMLLQDKQGNILQQFYNEAKQNAVQEFVTKYSPSFEVYSPFMIHDYEINSYSYIDAFKNLPLRQSAQLNKVCVIIANYYQTREQVNSLKENANACLLFNLLYKLLKAGELSVMTNIAKNFIEFIKRDTSFYGVLTKMFINDLALFNERLFDQQRDSFTLYEQMAYQLIKSENITDQLIHNFMTQYTFIGYEVPNEYDINLEIMNYLPEYFINNLNLRNQQDKKEDINIIECLQKFKSIKQLIQLKLFHQIVIESDLYECNQQQTYLSLYRFALDINQDYKQTVAQIKSLFAFLFKISSDLAIMIEILSQFTSADEQTLSLILSESVTIIDRINMGLNIMTEEIKSDAGDDYSNITYFFWSMFDRKFYINLITKEDPSSEFLEYLSIIVGLKEDEDGSALMDYQNKFLL